MHHVFEVNGSAVVLKSAEEALQVIHGNPDRVIAEDQTKKWENWAMTVLMAAGKMDKARVNGRVDPDAMRVLIAEALFDKEEG